jgi:hypothetical protein
VKKGQREHAKLTTSSKCLGTAVTDDFEIDPLGPAQLVWLGNRPSCRDGSAQFDYFWLGAQLRLKRIPEQTQHLKLDQPIGRSQPGSPDGCTGLRQNPVLADLDHGTG